MFLCMTSLSLVGNLQCFFVMTSLSLVGNLQVKTDTFNHTFFEDIMPKGGKFG